MPSRALPSTAAERARAIRDAQPPIEVADRTSDHRLKIAVAVPARDESAAIEWVLRSVPKDSTEVAYRCFVCDDGSTDGTGAIALDAGATVLRHSRNLGIGASLTTSLDGARAWNPDIIVHVASDGQDDPHLIPQLLQPLLRGEADYVIGSRFLTGAAGMGAVRRVGVRFYSLLVRLLVGLTITDVTSGFRAFRTEVYDRLRIRSDKNWAVETALRAGLNHLRTVEVPTLYLPRIGGRSQFEHRRLFLLYHLRVIPQIFRAYTAPRAPAGVPSRGRAPSTLEVPAPAPPAGLPARPGYGAVPLIAGRMPSSAHAPPAFHSAREPSTPPRELEA